tara:strand:+ start:50 stop:517 length:468 start_codon:yes stop_codon:yes gene_type:complete
MQLHIISVGNKPKKWEKSAFNEYKKRLPGNWKLTTDVINPVKRSKNDSRQAIDEEGRKIISRINKNEQIILLDESGENFSTKDFYMKMTSLAEINNKLCFVIGGADGVSNELKNNSSLIWAFSKLTLPHGLANIILIEQIYRAWTLMSNHPYHRD